MAKKSDLLKELGWNEKLIRHYMIEDSDYSKDEDLQLITEVYDSHSMIVTFSADNPMSNFVVKR